MHCTGNLDTEEELLERPEDEETAEMEESWRREKEEERKGSVFEVVLRKLSKAHKYSTVGGINCKVRRGHKINT